MLFSRRDFLLFTFRAHNAVNARLLKPVKNSVAECFEVLRTNVKITPANVYRNTYITHIRRYWRTMQDISGITALKKISEMMKIENEYSIPRNNNFEQDISEDIVVLPPRMFDKSGEEIPSPVRVALKNIGGGMVITSSGLRFRR
jgi:hypothetical protein